MCGVCVCVRERERELLETKDSSNPSHYVLVICVCSGEEDTHFYIRNGEIQELFDEIPLPVLKNSLPLVWYGREEVRCMYACRNTFVCASVCLCMYICVHAVCLCEWV